MTLSNEELDDLETEFSDENGWTTDEESNLRRLMAQAREANALREENERLAGALTKQADYMDRLAEQAETAAKDTRFITLSEAQKADAKNWRATAKAARAALQPAPDARGGDA